MDFFRKKWEIIVLILVMALGVFFRTYRLGELPGSMHRDELAISYNAYSIYKTGKDEWGEKTPLVFKSFGDYKQPAMVYATIPGIMLYGLTPLGSRLPAAILSSLAILSVFLFAKEIFGSKKMALMASFLLSISFWHIRDSRNIYEPVVILTLSILSYWALYKARKKTIYIFVSLLLFILSIFIYNTALFIYPPLFLFWLVSSWKKLNKNQKKLWLGGLAITLSVTMGVLSSSFGTSEGKSQTTIFYNSTLKDQHQGRVYRYWKSGVPLNSMLVSLDRLYQVGYHFIKSYIASVDVNYLFFDGGNNAWHNFESIDLGDMNPILLPFAVIGIIYMIKDHKKKQHLFMLALLIISPIPSSLTIDAPNTNRLIDFHLIVMLMAVYGLYKSIVGAKSKLSKYLIVFSAMIFFIFTSQFLLRYYAAYNKLLSKAWYPNVPTLIEKISQERKNYDYVFIQPTIDAGYMYYAFYTQLHPEVLQTETQKGAGSFNTVSRLQNVIFDSYTPEHEEDNVLLIDHAGTKVLPENLIFTIYDWDNKPAWIGHKIDILER